MLSLTVLVTYKPARDQILSRFETSCFVSIFVHSYTINCRGLYNFGEQNFIICKDEDLVDKKLRFGRQILLYSLKLPDRALASLGLKES